MVDLLNKPSLVFDHIRRYTTSLTSQIVYGFRTSRIDDPTLLVMYDNVEKFSAVTGAGAPAAALLLDVFPILRALPSAIRPFYNHALSLQEEAFGLASGLWKNAKREVLEGKAKVIVVLSLPVCPLHMLKFVSRSAFLLRRSRQRSNQRRTRRYGRCNGSYYSLGSQL